MLQLGQLGEITVTEHGRLGAWLLRMVEEVRAIRDSDDSLVVPLTLPAYKSALAKIEAIRRALCKGWQDNYVPGDSPELRRFAKEIYDPEQHTPDFAGYVRYVCDVNPALKNAVFSQMHLGAAELREVERHKHTYIVGGTGSGKSELLKLLIHHYVQHPQLGGVLVLDPHGKLAREVARWQEFAGAGASRLVYLDAMAASDMGGLCPALNPLVSAGASSDAVANLAEQLADALVYLAGEGEGQTAYMQRLGAYGLHVLLDRPGSTLADLARALMAPDGEPLVSLGRQHRDEDVRLHYLHQFLNDSHKSGRNGLAARLGGALRRPIFRRMMTAPGPLDLTAVLDAGKVVVVNCASAGKARVALGRLLMAQVAALGERRAFEPNRPKKPVHVFIDEATLLMAPPIFTILLELRKENIFLTMAQQSFADGLDSRLTKALVDNTNVKMLGRSGNLGQAFKRLGWETVGTPRIGDRQFVVSAGRAELMLLEAASHLVDDSNAMEEEAWRHVLAGQFAAYYRDMGSQEGQDAGEEAALPSPLRRTWRRN
jgi:hypothetical protein